MYSNATKQMWANSYHKSRIISHAIRLKKNKVSVKSLVKKHIREYCMMSTIHGLSYTVNDEYSKIERTFWSIVTIISLGVGTLLAYLLLYRYSVSPTIATLETYSYPTWRITFPAVTLCNVNKVRKSSVRTMVEDLSQYKINKLDVEQFFKKISALITRDKIEISAIDKVVQKYVMKHINGTIDDVMRLVSQPCSEMLVRCMWEGKILDCNKLFRASKSLEGYCCSFNYYLKHNANEPDVNYIGGTERKDGLTVVLNVNPEDYFSTSDPFYGIKVCIFRVLIHAPDVYPETSVLTEVIQPSRAVSLAINPYHVESKDNVKSLKLSQRMCLFPDEQSLKFIPNYDYQQCITECRIQTILAVCNCTPFIYPHDIDSSIICDLTNSRCMYENAGVFSNLLPNNTDGNSEILCSYCLPECSELIYTLSSSVSNVFFNNFSIGPHMKENESQLHVYYQDISSIKYRREAMATWDSLIASLGGIFGLCLGGSVLSIVELVYHFTFKMFKKIRNSKNLHRKIIPIYFNK